MKATTLIIILITLLASKANAKEFWEHFAESISYKVSVQSSIIPSERFNSKVVHGNLDVAIMRAFTQTLSVRTVEVAKSTRLAIIPCMFFKEAEKCYSKVVLNKTFDEIGFMNAPGFSTKTLRKFQGLYSRNLVFKETPESKRLRADSIPRFKAFNFKFGIDLMGMDIVMAMPFYTYKGVYVEPKFTLKHQASISFMKNRVALEFNKEGAALSYKFKKQPFGNNYYTVTIRPEGEINVDTVLLTW